MFIGFIILTIHVFYPKINCFGEWSFTPWSKCGEGAERTKTYKIKLNEQNGGAACTIKDNHQEKEVSNVPCEYNITETIDDKVICKGKGTNKKCNENYCMLGYTHSKSDDLCYKNCLPQYNMNFETKKCIFNK